MCWASSERLADRACPPLVGRLTLCQFSAGLCTPGSTGSTIPSAVCCACGSVRNLCKGMRVLPPCICEVRVKAGPGPAPSLHFRGRRVHFPRLPEVVKWSRLLCVTVLLEPTNSRVAFVILRNEPPRTPHTLCWTSSVVRVCCLSFLLF